MQEGQLGTENMGSHSERQSQVTGQGQAPARRVEH